MMTADSNMVIRRMVITSSRYDTTGVRGARVDSTVVEGGSPVNGPSTIGFDLSNIASGMPSSLRILSYPLGSAAYSHDSRAPDESIPGIRDSDCPS